MIAEMPVALLVERKMVRSRKQIVPITKKPVPREMPLIIHIAGGVLLGDTVRSGR